METKQRFERMMRALVRVADASEVVCRKLHPSMDERSEVKELRAALDELADRKKDYEAESGFKTSRRWEVAR